MKQVGKVIGLRIEETATRQQTLYLLSVIVFYNIIQSILNRRKKWQ